MTLCASSATRIRPCTASVFRARGRQSPMRHVSLIVPDPGPEHGCFSCTGADPEYEGHYSKQVLDCISQLAPPLRLVTMSFLTARNALRTNTAESIAELTGGEFRRFHDAKDLKTGLFAVSNDVPNYYVLSFQPAEAT